MTNKSFITSSATPRNLIRGKSHTARNRTRFKMTAAKIIGGVVGSFAIAYACDVLISDEKIFGGSTPKTITEKEWWEETDKKFQRWPRTAGPPVVMNPISRQNFIVKSSDS